MFYLKTGKTIGKTKGLKPPFFYPKITFYHLKN